MMRLGHEVGRERSDEVLWWCHSLPSVIGRRDSALESPSISHATAYEHAQELEQEERFIFHE